MYIQFVTGFGGTTSAFAFGALLAAAARLRFGFGGTASSAASAAVQWSASRPAGQPASSQR